MDINLQDNKTESVILHVGINDVLQNSTETNINIFSNNVQEMAEKCCSSSVNNIFISGLVYAERFNVKTIENIHDKMIGLCFNFNLRYINSRNINDNHLFKDRLHLVESGKTILANKFICNLNNLNNGLVQTSSMYLSSFRI